MVWYMDMAPHSQRHAPRPGGRPNILIAMIEAGGGHKAAAAALEAQFTLAYPGQFEVRTLDFMAAVGEVALDRRHKRTWSWLLDHPKVAYLAQRAIDGAVPPVLTNLAQDVLLRRFSRRASAFVNDHRIDLVIAVHFMPLRALAAAAARGDHDAALVGVDTELFDGNALWAERRMDELMVATEPCRAGLEARGVPADRLSVTGYPLHPKYLQVDKDARSMRARLGMGQDRFTVVHVAGGEGIGGALEATARAVAGSDDGMQYVAICGGNETLRQRLQELALQAPPGVLRVEGFVDNLHEYLVASDVVVGKAGPGVTMETMAVGRPIVHTSFASASERANIDFCTRHQIGMFLTDPGAIVVALRALDRDRERLGALQHRAAALAPLVGTASIVNRVAERLGVTSHGSPTVAGST